MMGLLRSIVQVFLAVLGLLLLAVGLLGYAFDWYFGRDFGSSFGLAIAGLVIFLLSAAWMLRR